MKLEGGCYCRALRYVAEGEPVMKAQCHCRNASTSRVERPTFSFAMPIAGFSYTKGAAQKVHPQRSRTAGHSRILHRLRHPYRNPSAWKLCLSTYNREIWTR